MTTAPLLPEESNRMNSARSGASGLHVLMVSFRYLPFMGGVELHVDQVARRLAARGVDITVLTTDPTGTLPTEEHLDGVHVRRVRAWPANRDYYFAPRIYTEIVRGHWDVVHVQAYHTFVGPLAMLAARRARLPYVLTFHAGGHSSRLRHRLRPLQLSLVRPLLARADRLIALDQFEIEHYSQRLGVPRERFALISNGSDLPRPASLGLVARDDSLIASLGRLERYKGHHKVVAAMPRILEQLPEARLWIAGSGPYEPDLRKLVAALGVSEAVEIRAVPVEEREQMARELSRVKLVVSLSEFETQPIAALEALALGCRLVVADTPGLSALAAKGFARAVPLDSPPEEIAAIVLDELARPSIADPPKLPTWDECADGLLDLYESVAAGPRSET
jgi:glycosyltransferase involved in cell wall biosynthesis